MEIVACRFVDVILLLCPNRVFFCRVQGLRGDSAVKIDELLLTMSEREIDILCIQETHLNGAECCTREGYAICLSGCRDSDERSYAGVEFIV